LIVRENEGNSQFEFCDESHETSVKNINRNVESKKPKENQCQIIMEYVEFKSFVETATFAENGDNETCASEAIKSLTVENPNLVACENEGNSQGTPVGNISCDDESEIPKENESRFNMEYEEFKPFVVESTSCEENNVGIETCKSQAVKCLTDEKDKLDLVVFANEGNSQALICGDSQEVLVDNTNNAPDPEMPLKDDKQCIADENNGKICVDEKLGDNTEICDEILLSENTNQEIAIQDD
jgi:hypothetical protein